MYSEDSLISSKDYHKNLVEKFYIFDDLYLG